MGRSIEPCLVAVLCCSWSVWIMAAYCNHCDHYWLIDETPFYLSLEWQCLVLSKGEILGFCPFSFHLTLFPHSLSIWKLNDAGIFSLWCKPSDLELLVSFLANPWHDGTPMEFPANPPTVELWNIILWSLSVHIGVYPPTVELWNIILWSLSVHIGVYVLFYILSLLCLDW